MLSKVTDNGSIMQLFLISVNMHRERVLTRFSGNSTQTISNKDPDTTSCVFSHEGKHDGIAHIGHVQLMVMTRGAAAKNVSRLVAHPEGNSGHHITSQKSGAVTNKFVMGDSRHADN